VNQDLRTLFPGVSRRIYLDVSAQGLVPQPVRDAVDTYLDEAMLGGGEKARMHAMVEETRIAFAALIGAFPDEIAITKNVSEGLNLFAASLPWERGDNVVICPGLEHPNNIYLWYNLERLRGIEVRAVPPADGHMPAAAMAAAMDRRTRVVTFPSVSFAPGFVTDVATLVDAARSVGALTLMDAAQSVGALRTHVRHLGIDALAVATQKCLLGLYGFAFLYVRREVAESLIPIQVARYGIDLGDAHETAFATGELRYQKGARRFDLGNYNYLGAAAARAALRLIEWIGMDRIEPHVRGLAADLASGLLELGLPVVGGAPDAHLAHIVSVGALGDGRHDTSDDPLMNDLFEFLTRRDVRLSIRSGVLRFSLGVYNDHNDVERVIALARAWRGERV
jgi:cysteine desulfurase/selenocysteine lyase